ncbi:ATP-binding protein [Saccharothrix sp. ST-888]|uniref:ATP-binding protein n=1 Tax=Saccharothrix sp. ST-888 TaxID=1427391 RepID=UPI0009E5FD61|nr:ATP-binding protein [Saccharothrix sp. ST-888]
MAGWGEAEWASHPGAGLAADDQSGSRSSILETLELLTPQQVERECFGRLCEQVGVEEEVCLPSRPELVRVVRRIVLKVLQDWQLPQLLEVGELLAGELMANAVRHTGGRKVGLRLTRRPGWLRVEVRDSSRALPCLILAEPGNENGYGMKLVDALSERWGADLLPRGKGVWFELKVRERTA